MDPQIAAQFLGTLIQSSATFLAIYLGIIIFIVQDKTLAPFFLEHWQAWSAFGISCALWVETIAFCVDDFTTLNLNTQFSSRQIQTDLLGFFAALSLSLGSFALMLALRRNEKSRVL